MRGRHGERWYARRVRRPWLTFIRFAIALAVPAFVIAQPTGAAPKPVRVVVTTTTSTSTTTTSTTTSTTSSTTTTAAPRSTTPTSAKPQHWGADAEPVALTFDDGPSATYTPQVLDVLREFGVPATFFVVGQEAQEHPELVQAVVAAGHTVGNHTWSHADLNGLDEDGFRAEVDRTEELLNGLVGGTVPCVRPPFGHIDDVGRTRLQQRGLRMVRWSTSSEDWKRPGVDAIVKRTLGGARPGAVILLHDGGPDMSETVAALPDIIRGIRAKGLSFRSICAAT